MEEKIFVLACLLAVISWLTAIIEMILIHSFVAFFFYIGIPVYRKTIKFSSADVIIPYNQVIRKEEGKFYFKSNNKVYFLSRMTWSNFFRVQTPFPFKAIASLESDNHIKIIGRLPIGTTLFFLFWSIGWTVGIGFTNLIALGFGLIGWIVLVSVILISYIVERGRMEMMMKEFKIMMTAHNRAQPQA